MVNRLSLLTCLLLVLAPAARAEQVTLDLPTGSKLAAEFAAPAGAKRGPAVIYLHGAAVRDLGAAGAAERGQDMASFAAAFADRGFAAIAPVRRTPMETANGDAVIDEGLAAVLASAGFLQTRPEVDPARIAVVGYGEGATIALWAAARMPDLAAAVAISPSRMNGRRSQAATMRMARFLAGDGIAALRAPVLLIVGTEESRTALRTGEELSVALEALQAVPLYPELPRRPALVRLATPGISRRRRRVPERAGALTPGRLPSGTPPSSSR